MPLRLLRDRRFWQGSGPWWLVLFLATNLYVLHLQNAFEREKARNLLQHRTLLPTATAQEQALPGAVTDRPRYDWSVGENLSDYWPYIPDATARPLTLLTGMSQMYAINEAMPGDQTIAEHMDDMLAYRGVHIFGLAAPNLSNEEALFLLLAALSQRETRPYAFVYGVCFDKFRNLDLRPGYQEFMRNRPAVQHLWQTLAAEYAIQYPMASAKMLQSLAALQPADKRQTSIETRLRQFVATWIPAVAAQKRLNGEFQLMLYDLRNWLLQIKNTTKRPIIQSRYDLNKEFLQLMIDIAEHHGVRLILYVIPLNHLAENPYIPAQYHSFKDWVSSLAQDRSVPFANLEHVIPDQYWGEFMGGPDFKHFKGEGHRLTAQALVEHFGHILTLQAERAAYQ